MIERELELTWPIPKFFYLFNFQKVQAFFGQHHVFISLLHISGLSQIDYVTHFNILVILVQFLSIVYAFLFDSLFHVKLADNDVALRLIDDDRSFFTGKEHVVLGVSVKLCEFHALGI